MYDYTSLVPRLSPSTNKNFSILQAPESWVGAGNYDYIVLVQTIPYDTQLQNLPVTLATVQCKVSFVQF